jgi:hypothetical protein
MFRKSLWLGLALMLVVVTLASVSVDARPKKKKGREHASGPPSLSLTADVYTVRTCEDAIVRLEARSNGAAYKWTVNGGRLRGDGPNTSWDLSKAAPGVYQAVVQVDDGHYHDCAAFSSISVVVLDCPPPPIIPPKKVCPTVRVSCPDSITENAPVTFTATISGGEGVAYRTYNWKVSAGTITSGQNTSSITVDTKGLAGQTIRADLEVSGYDEPCPASCEVTIPKPPKSHQFDEYYNIARNDEKARLDNYVIELQNEPSEKGYIIINPSRRARKGEAEARAKRISDYLINTRGIDASRFEIIMGHPGEDWLFELWLVPAGATPPSPSR